MSDQEDLVRRLEETGFPGASVQRIDTHLSHVLLVGVRAYKIKRDITLPFADFSTLALRREALEKEYEINRRNAPALYLGVRPIVETAAGPRIGADGAAAEWALEMVRFDDTDRLDRAIDAGRVDDRRLRMLADRLAEAHLAAPRAQRVAPFSDILTGLADGLETHADGGIRPALVTWRARAEREAARLAPFLDRRTRRGLARACHGDLHLANLAFVDGAPTPFDAIEFNRDLTDIDVQYDLAFLLMDLVGRDRREAANLVLNRWLSRTRDYAGLAAAPLFLSTRAAVRALALSMPGAQDDARAAGYADLAARLSAPPPPPRLLAVGGLSGGGKSTLARALACDVAPDVGAVVIPSDLVRKRMFGVDPEARLPESAYGAGPNAAVGRRMLRDARRALAAGRAAVLDATFLRAADRSAARALAERAGVPFSGLWLDAPEDVLRARVRARRGDVSDAGEAVLERQLASLDPPPDWTRIDAAAAPEARRAAARAAIGVKAR